MSRQKTWKDRLVPVLLFAAVFAAEFILRRHTFFQKEYFSLFLNTPDYWNELWNGPHPLSTLAGDFIAQFYRIAWIGPALVALAATLCFLLLRLFMRRFQIPLAVLVFAVLLIAALLPKSRERERWARVEYGSWMQQWDKVIAAATPEAAAKDRVLIPYALLAFSQEGTLPANLFRYPVTGPQDIDLEGEITRHGYFFSQMNAECLGCTNEAIHHSFQTACTTPHGMSLGTLRQLIKYNIASGNLAMARKYCDILEKNPMNAATARAARKYIATLPAGSHLDAGPSEEAAVVSHNTFQTLRAMAQEGLFDQAAADRSRCLLLLQRDLRNFTASIPEGEDIAALPLCYQQALCLVADADLQRKISPAVIQAFQSYMEAYNQIRMKEEDPIQPGTYWEYYFLGY